MKFAVVGNCQAATMMYALQVLTGCQMPTMLWGRPDLVLQGDRASADVLELFARHDKVFMQPAFWNLLAARHPELQSKVVLYPAVAFAAYHPDIVYVRRKPDGHHIYGPFHDYQSSIALLGWEAGLSAGQTLALFNPDTFSRLGFFDYWNPSVAALIEEGRAAGMELGGMLDAWSRRGTFMYSMNHPKPFVILEIARRLLEKQRIPAVSTDLQPYIYDLPVVAGVWPVYPEIGERLGVAGHHVFKLGSDLQPDQPLRLMSLKGYVDASFEVFSRHERGELECDRLQTQRYRQLLDELRAKAPPRKAALSVATDAAASRLEPGAAGFRFAVLGNAQAGQMARCLQSLVGGTMPHEEQVTPAQLADWAAGRSSLGPLFETHDKVFVQPWIWSAIAERYAQFENKVVLYPSIAFMAYHPDFVEVQVGEGGPALSDGPMGRCHSALAFLAWSAGLDVAQTVSLFRREVFEQLGYLDYWQGSELALLEEGRAAGLPLDAMLERWKARGCFMHMPAHPKLSVIADIAGALLERLGIPALPFELTGYAHDHLADDFVWPVYPDVGDVLGCAGAYEFKQRQTGPINDATVTVLGLSSFVEQSFAAFARYQPQQLQCRRLAWQKHRDFFAQLQGLKIPAAGTGTKGVGSVPAPERGHASPSHPYAGLPEHRFWRTAIQKVPPTRVDPVIATKFRIKPDTRIATAGSCFALNISRRLIARGYNFLQVEAGQDGPDAAVEGVGGMGLFSARFGYLYTARQLRQLMERAYGAFVPDENAWRIESGRWVDPFRPRAEPGGFASITDLERARELHLAAVRRMFESLDVFVFTLGLTEAWRSRSDGAVFSVAPGVAGGEMDFDRYEFVNFTVAEVDADLQAFIRDLQRVNPKARLILTVSPVPILATYEDRHVLVASTYTKSVLRVAAEQVSRRNTCCDYFPGYELVNGSFHGGSYIAEDKRSVTPEGVDHVMRLFFEHYVGEVSESRPVDAELLIEARRNIGVICDEELLEAAIR